MGGISDSTAKIVIGAVIAFVGLVGIIIAFAWGIDQSWWLAVMGGVGVLVGGGVGFWGWRARKKAEKRVMATSPFLTQTTLLEEEDGL